MDKDINLFATKFILNLLTEQGYLRLSDLYNSTLALVDSEETEQANINLKDYCLSPAFFALNGLILDNSSIKINEGTFLVPSDQSNINYIEIDKIPTKSFTVENKWITTLNNLTVQIGETLGTATNTIDNDINYYELLSETDLDINLIDSDYSELCAPLKIKKLVLNNKAITGIDCSNLEELVINLTGLVGKVESPLIKMSEEVVDTNAIPKNNLTVTINNGKIDFTSYLEGLPINTLNYFVEIEDSIDIKTDNIENIALISNNFNKIVDNSILNYKTIDIYGGNDLIDISFNSLSYPNLTKVTIEDKVFSIGEYLFKTAPQFSELTINTLSDTLDIKDTGVIIKQQAFQCANPLNVYLPNIQINQLSFFDPTATDKQLYKGKLNIATNAFTSGSKLYCKDGVFIWSNIKEIPSPFAYKDIEDYKTYYQLSSITTVNSNDNIGGTENV